MNTQSSVYRAGAVAALLTLLIGSVPLRTHAADSKIPRLPNGKPDFSGIWQTTSAADYDLEPHGPRKDAPPSAGVVEGGVIPYLPAALEKKKQNFNARLTADPRLKCWTLGTPRGIYYPEPFQVFQRDRDLTIVFQFGQSVRTIHTNNTRHPVETDNEFWLGDSRGRFEGDTLVVDVTDFGEDTWLDRAGNFHSPKLHVVERWTFLDAQHHRIQGDARRSERVQPSLDFERHPASSSRKEFSVDRELLLHARLRQVLPGAARGMNRAMNTTITETFVMLAKARLLAWPPASARETEVVLTAARIRLAIATLLAIPALTFPQFATAQEGGGRQRETSFSAIESGKWTGKRLRDGQPDVAGHWSNTIGNHNNFTDPQGGLPGDPSRRARPNTTREQRAPSRISDPPDGQIPFQPWARAKQEEFLKFFHDPKQPQYIEPLARCAPAGVPKSFMWHGYEIRQFPGYVLFLFDSGTRIIHLDGKPHLPESIKLWNADSRGHWEGNTLIVEVTNNNGKARLGRTGEFYQRKRAHRRALHLR